MRRWTASTLRRSRQRSLAGMSTSAAAIAPSLPDRAPPSTSTDLNSSDCLTLARRLLLSGDLPAARQLIAGVAASSPLPESLAADLGDSLRCLLDAGLPRRAEELFLAFFPEVNLSPTPELMNCMVVCYTQLGKLSLAFDWLVRMIKTGSLSDNSGYVALLQQLCFDGKLGDATILFFQMYKLRMLPCSSSCTTLIWRLCWVGKLNEAFYVFNLALNAGVKPTLGMYRSLLPAFCRSGLVEDAEALLCDTMDSYGLVPDIAMYSVVIRTYCKEGKMNRAEGLLEKIKENGWKPDVFVYNSLIEGFLSLSNEDGGWKHFRLMVEDGVERNDYSYYMLLNHCCKGMKLECAFKVWNEMVCHGISPNIRCYQSLVCALYKEEEILGANRFLQEMLERGLLPDHFMFTKVIKACPIEGKPIVALMILKAFYDNDVVTSFIRKLCSPDDTEV